MHLGINHYCDTFTKRGVNIGRCFTSRTSSVLIIYILFTCSHFIVSTDCIPFGSSLWRTKRRCLFAALREHWQSYRDIMQGTWTCTEGVY